MFRLLLLVVEVCMDRTRISRLTAVMSLAVLALTLGVVARAEAQPLGEFRWQQQPYCNVVTLTITQSAGIFLLDGFDDQCGAARRAAAVGIAFSNPDGSIGMGLTIVTTPGGTPVHLDATVNLATISGTWRDSSSDTGTWLFTSGPGAGSPRPPSRAAFPGGLSAGGATITSVATPTAPADATNKAYVDAGVAAAQALARAIASTPLVLTAYSGTAVSGTITPGSGGCVELAAGGASLSLDLPLPLGASIATLSAKYIDTSSSDLTFSLRTIDTVEGGTVNDSFLATVNSASDTGFHTVAMSFTPAPPVSISRTYYLLAEAPAHTQNLSLCGVQLSYAAP